VCLVECLLGIFCCGRLKVFLVYRRPTGSVPWTAVGFVFLELLKSALMENFQSKDSDQ
jgi:hypothetical protein